MSDHVHPGPRGAETVHDHGHDEAEPVVPEGSPTNGDQAGAYPHPPRPGALEYQEHTHGPQAAVPGLPVPPDDLPPRGRMRRAAPIEGSVPHFWRGGPVQVQKITPRWVTMRNGKTKRCDFEVRWFLARVAGTTKRKALQRMYDVVLDPQGWIQTGIHFKRVNTREDATILVRVIPANETVCGEGAAGCFSWGYEPDGLPAAEMGVEYIDRDGAWDIIVGMELCGHGATNMEDMYTPDHQPYVGSMGTWRDAAAVGYRPTVNEILYARQEIEGTVDQSLVHH